MTYCFIGCSDGEQLTFSGGESIMALAQYESLSNVTRYEDGVRLKKERLEMYLWK